MSLYLAASKTDKLKIRREMLRQTETFLSLAGIKGNIKYAARQIVDSALAEETHGHTEGSDAQQPTIH